LQEKFDAFDLETVLALDAFEDGRAF